MHHSILRRLCHAPIADSVSTAWTVPLTVPLSNVWRSIVSKSEFAGAAKTVVSVVVPRNRATDCLCEVDSWCRRRLPRCSVAGQLITNPGQARQRTVFWSSANQDLLEFGAKGNAFDHASTFLQNLAGTPQWLVRRRLSVDALSKRSFGAARLQGGCDPQDRLNRKRWSMRSGWEGQERNGCIEWLSTQVHCTHCTGCQSLSSLHNNCNAIAAALQPEPCYWSRNGQLRTTATWAEGDRASRWLRSKSR